MSNAYKTIVADLSDDIRDQILNFFPPLHCNVYCWHVTAAYKHCNVVVEDGIAIITGIVNTDRVQVLLLNINGSDFRPDGKPWHLTLSTAEGVPPKEGGEVALSHVAGAAYELSFPVVFQKREARIDSPQVLI